MGEKLFNGNIFLKAASDKASDKATRTMTSCIFNAVELLKAIVMKAVRLNINGIDEYAKVQNDFSLTSPSQERSMFRPRHNITRARKIANGLVAHHFTIENLMFL